METPAVPCRIVLAENNPADVHLVRAALREHDIECDLNVIPDGEAVLSFFRTLDQDPELPHPDLLLLDLHLPKYNGAEVLKRLRASERFGLIPVVIMTGSDIPADCLVAEANAALHYFRKPFGFRQFMRLGTIVKFALKHHPRLSAFRDSARGAFMDQRGFNQPESCIAETQEKRNGSVCEMPLPSSDLGQGEAELLDFIENADVALHWVGEDGRILWANAAELNLLGYTSDEYIGRNITEFHVDEPVITDILGRLKNNEKITGYEARLRCKDGTIRYVSINSSVYRREGKFAHTRCVTLDLTEQKKNTELQQRLAAILESSDDAIIGKNLQGTILSWNRGAERIFGYTAEEVVGKHISVIASEDRVDEIPGILERVSRGERVEHYETRRKTKDGRILTVSLTVSPIRDATGEIIAASKISRDTTDQQRSFELRERLAAIVESSDDAIISKDLDGIIRSWNGGAERLFGYTKEEIIGRHVSTLAAPERIDEIPDILDRIKRGESVEHYETRRRAKDGRILTVSLTVSPIRDATGKVIGASKVARDITARERHEEALREANEALVQSNADLQQFAHSASHDLQEPLRMVSTYSELLMRQFGGALGAEGNEYLGYTLQGAQRMDQLLRDLRAYTLASTQGKEPAESVDTGAVLDKALANLESVLKDSGARITRTELPRLRVHEFHFEQIFQNLIGNAIRYRSAAPPEIHISATRRRQEWLFSVEDNGIGIDQKYKEQIFDLFKRLHSVADYPGTGMGLAICKRVVERAGGRIWVESEPGRGSTFFFTVPDGRR